MHQLKPRHRPTTSHAQGEHRILLLLLLLLTVVLFLLLLLGVELVGVLVVVVQVGVENRNTANHVWR